MGRSSAGTIQLSGGVGTQMVAAFAAASIAAAGSAAAGSAAACFAAACCAGAAFAAAGFAAAGFAAAVAGRSRSCCLSSEMCQVCLG